MARRVTLPPVSTLDVTRLVERLAGRLARAGSAHPVAAAVAIACRGNAALDVEQFARVVAVEPDVVRACEDGRVAFGDLPAMLVEGHDGLDLLALADLDAQIPARRSAQNM
jgi:hypothetical protein